MNFVEIREFINFVEMRGIYRFCGNGEGIIMQYASSS